MFTGWHRVIITLQVPFKWPVLVVIWLMVLMQTRRLALALLWGKQHFTLAEPFLHSLHLQQEEEPHAQKEEAQECRPLGQAAGGCGGESHACSLQLLARVNPIT